MRLQVTTCLLPLVALLAAPTPGTGAAIGTSDDRWYWDDRAGTKPSDEEPTVGRPLWKTGPDSSPYVGGSQASSVRLEEASAVTAEPPQNISAGVAQQLGTSEPPMEMRPLLDVDELVAYERRRKKKLSSQPTTSTPWTTTAPVPAAASERPEAGEDLTSQLAEVIKSILDESAVQGQTTTQRPRQPPRVDLTSQKPPLESTGNTTKVDEFLPQLEEILKSVLVKHKPAEPQRPCTAHLTPPQTSKVADTEEDLKHILPSLEEAIGSIFKDSEGKIPITTSRPAVPPVHLPMTDIRRPSLSDAEEDLKHILPTLEEAIGSILKNTEAKIPVTTSRPSLPPVHPPTTDIQRPSLSGAEEDLKHILPTLEETIGSILEDSEAKIPATTSRPSLPPVHPPTTGIRPPSLSGAEEDLKHIIPTLEETIGSILEDSEAKVLTTTSRPVPVLPPVRPTTSDSRKQFAAVLPQLEEAIGSVLDEAVLEQEAAAQQHTSPPSAWEPRPPPTKDHGFDKFLPQLELMFGDILRNSESEHSATFSNATDLTSTVKTPVLPVIAPTEEKPSLQTNVIEPDTPSSQSQSVFQAVQSALQDIFNSQEIEAKTPRTLP